MGRAYQNRKESMAKTSDMKARVYSRYGREIYVIAKSGGPHETGSSQRSCQPGPSKKASPNSRAENLKASASIRIRRRVFDQTIGFWWTQPLPIMAFLFPI